MDNRRPNSVHFLITTGLGYCCEWLFFQLYQDSNQIADRLGVQPRAIRRHKAAAAEGACAACEGCMERRLKARRA